MTIKQLEQNIQTGTTLRGVAQAYAEISSMRLKKTRQTIERNKQFASEIAQVFHTLKFLSLKKAAASEIIRRLLEKNGQTVNIILTSNSRFYGELHKSLLDHFLEVSPQGEIIVVGKMGIDYLHAVNFERPFQGYLFSRDIPSAQEFSDFSKKVSAYQTVLVFHSAFKTVLTQQPKVTDITQSVIAAEDISVDSQQHLDFILEPELEAILTFFDSQIVSLLLESAILETELARTASRLVSMGNAEKNAQDFLGHQRVLLSSAKMFIYNAKLIETVSAYIQAQKEGMIYV